MKIEGDTIVFKSTNDNFCKEKSGIKPYTIRRLSLWSEMMSFEQLYFSWKYNIWQQPQIKIINTDRNEEFTKTISDISQFEGLWIISWR